MIYTVKFREVNRKWSKPSKMTGRRLAAMLRQMECPYNLQDVRLDISEYGRCIVNGPGHDISITAKL